MSKQDDKRRRAKYTLEFKLEAVRLVKGGQDVSVTARVLDIPKRCRCPEAIVPSVPTPPRRADFA